jgi:hypothetical protein
MSSRIRLVLATLTLALVADACMSDSTVTPDRPATTATLDAALSEFSLPALDYASATFSGAGLVTPAISPSRCQFDGGSGSFVCDALTGYGLTLNQQYTLLDGAGSKQSAYDKATTAGLVVNSAVAGTSTGYIGSDPVSLTVDGQQELTLTGLGSAQHTVNGTSLTVTTLAHSDNSTPPITSTITTRVVDLVIPAPLPDDPAPWPVSGMVELKSTTDLGYVIPLDAANTTTSAAMEFSGSSTVKLTITTQNGTQTCRVDITTSMLGC